MLEIVDRLPVPKVCSVRGNQQVEAETFRVLGNQVQPGLIWLSPDKNHYDGAQLNVLIQACQLRPAFSRFDKVFLKDII